MTADVFVADRSVQLEKLKSISRLRPPTPSNTASRCLTSSSRCSNAAKTFANSVPNADSISLALSNSLERTHERAAAVRRHCDRRRYHDPRWSCCHSLAGTEARPRAGAIQCCRCCSRDDDRTASALRPTAIETSLTNTTEVPWPSASCPTSESAPSVARSGSGDCSRRRAAPPFSLPALLFVRMQ
jgi:hypothetical protein